MITRGLGGVDFVVCNTDAQHLASCLTENRVQLGKASGEVTVSQSETVTVRCSVWKLHPSDVQNWPAVYASTSFMHVDACSIACSYPHLPRVCMW
jgi:hypothetical protein